MTEPLEPIGFWSYTTSDDTASRGRLSQLRLLIRDELQLKIGRWPKVHIFQDVAAIPYGADWLEEVHKALGSSSFLIPIVTPAFLQSEMCCQEVIRFRQREIVLGRGNLIFPLHYISVDDLDPNRSGDCHDPKVLELLRSRQWVDFRPLRLRASEHPSVAEKLDTFSNLLRDVLRRTHNGSPPPEISATATIQSIGRANRSAPANEHLTLSDAEQRTPQEQRPAKRADPGAGRRGPLGRKYMIAVAVAVAIGGSLMFGPAVLVAVRSLMENIEGEQLAQLFGADTTDRVAADARRQTEPKATANATAGETEAESATLHQVEEETRKNVEEKVKDRPTADEFLQTKLAELFDKRSAEDEARQKEAEARAQNLIAENAAVDAKQIADLNAARTLLDSGVTYADKGEFDRAIQDYDQAIKIYPKFPLAFYERGMAYASKRQYSRAIQDYDQAIKLDPNNASTFSTRGVAYAEQRQYDLAIQDYDQAIKLAPNFARAFSNRGMAYASKRQYDLAIRDYDQAIKLAPNYARAFFNRGNAFAQQGKHGRAIQDYDHAIKLNPNYALAFTNRGLAYAEQRQYDLAIQDYDQAINLDPNYAHAFSDRGDAYLEKRQFDLAIDDYDRAIKIDPNYAPTFTRRGFAYESKGQYDRAIQDYDQAIKLDPNYARAFYERGMAYAIKRQYDRAIQDYDQAIKLNPNYFAAFYYRGDAYFRSRQYDRAIQNYDQAIKLDLKAANAWFFRGIAKRRKSDFRGGDADIAVAKEIQNDIVDFWAKQGVRP